MEFTKEKQMTYGVSVHKCIDDNTLVIKNGEFYLLLSIENLSEPVKEKIRFENFILVNHNTEHPYNIEFHKKYNDEIKIIGKY